MICAAVSRRTCDDEVMNEKPPLPGAGSIPPKMLTTEVADSPCDQDIANRSAWKIEAVELANSSRQRLAATVSVDAVADDRHVHPVCRTQFLPPTSPLIADLQLRLLDATRS